MKDEIPLPRRRKLVEALEDARLARMNRGTLSPEDLAEIVEAAEWALHTLPAELDFVDMATFNPPNQVYFRAGLLACREHIACLVEHCGYGEIAQSIRTTWWPHLGADPGKPRVLDFAEFSDEIQGPDGKAEWRSKDVSINVEALPRAFDFLKYKG